MATYYVKSSATGANNGSSWANAFTSVVAASASPRTGGDIFYVSSTHDESSTGTTAFIPGSNGGITASSPQRFFSVNDSATPPTALLAGAKISTTGAFNMQVQLNTEWNGFIFTAGDGSSTANLTISASGSAATVILRNCQLRLGGTGTGTRINLNGSTAASRDLYLELINTTVFFRDVSQAIGSGGGRIVWRDTPSAIDAAGTIPDSLFAPSTGLSPQFEIAGVDLSALGSGKAIVLVNSFNSPNYSFRNCLINAAVTPVSGTIPGSGGTEVTFDNCDSGATNYLMRRHRYTGLLLTEATIVKASGASDGTTPISWKMTSSASARLEVPLASAPILIWNDTSGSAKTVTVDVVHDSGTNLKNNDVWLQVEYPGSSSNPRSSFADNRVANVLATATDQAASTATWTTTGLSSPNKQKLSATITPQMKGLLRARVMLGKPSYTVYVDPLLVVT